MSPEWIFGDLTRKTIASLKLCTIKEEIKHEINLKKYNLYFDNPYIISVFRNSAIKPK